MAVFREACSRTISSGLPFPALPDWATLPDEAIDGLTTELFEIFDRFPVDQTPNESQTEDDLIWPILETLGWTR